jgi:hypothetical protein
MDIQDYKDRLDDVIGELDTIYNYYKTLRDLYNSVKSMEILMESTDADVREFASDVLITNRIRSENLIGYFDKVERTSWVRNRLNELGKLYDELVDMYYSTKDDVYLDFATEILSIENKHERRFKKLNM